ncbi:MAG TPA: STAS domain-containing protein [Solirubrobacteraceae bacterium]|jgi:anti-sigma B factor antagonist
MATPAGLEITDGGEPTQPILALAGELDLGTLGGLAGHVQGVLAPRPRSLVIDLTDLRFMDSSGLRLLIELDERARREGWRLALIPSVHDSANTVLRMTGADTALPFELPPAA